MVDLQWARYKGDKGTRYLLAFHLGIKEGKHVLLECQKVPNLEAEILKAIKPQLEKLPLDERVAMVKELCPIAMRNAYRKISSARYEVVQKY